MNLKKILDLSKIRYLIILTFMVGWFFAGWPIQSVYAVVPSFQTGAMATGNGDTVTISKPSGTVAGDLLVAVVNFEKGSNVTTFTAPSGWTLIRRDNQSTNIGMATFYKIAGASEGSSYAWTLNGGPKWAAGIARLSGVNATLPINVSGGSIATTGNPAAPSVTTTLNDTIILAFYTNKKDPTYIPEASTQERWDAPNTAGGQPSNMMATFELISSGASGVKTATPLDSSVSWVAQQVAIAGIISTPTPTPASSQPGVGTINVVKVVINDNGRTKIIADFPLFVNGISVISGVTNFFPAPATVYTISETGDLNYTRSFSGDCDFNGQLNLNPGQNKFCIITNNDIGASTTATLIPPLIDVVRLPMPISLPDGPGSLVYTYSLRNTGTVPVADITMMDDNCGSVELISGDTNNDSKLGVGEIWMYACSAELLETTTGTVTATGWANGLSAVDISSTTVIVGSPELPDTGVIPPLIHVTKIPNLLVLPAGGGLVIYTNTVTNPGLVALDYVYLTDDHCSPIVYMSGDINGDRRLDTTEAWTYTCQTNLIETTTNTVMARGEASGLVARDLAIIAVVVSANPNFPNTGSLSTLIQQVKSITVDFSEGSIGANVNIIQKFLVSENKGSAARALGAHGTTFYFGSLTKAALIEWQTAVGIAPATGTFGSATRAYIGTHYQSL